VTPVHHDAAARLRARVFSSIAAHPSRTRAEGRRRAALLYAAASAIMFALFELAGGLEHSAERPSYLTARIALGVAAIAVCGASIAFGRGGSMTGRGAFVLIAAAIAQPLALFAWLTSWDGTYALRAHGDAMRCALLTIAIGCSLLVADRIVRRTAMHEWPRAAGAASGAAAGAIAGVLVAMWCPLVDAAHVATGHAAPLVILVVAGMLLFSASP
jgi:hypothetical protein